MGQFGGSVKVSKQASVRVTYSVLKKNAAEGDGGSVHVEKANIIFRSSEVSENSAESRGGGIFLDKQGKLNATDTLFLRNFAESEGGGLFFGHRSTSYLTDCQYIKNTAQEEGGAMFAADSRVLHISSSAAEGSEAVYLKRVKTGYNIDNEWVNARNAGSSKFSEWSTDVNTSNIGDGMSSVNAIPGTDCFFFNNQAVLGEGGGVVVSRGGKMSINGCGMYNNYVASKYGGAVVLRDKAQVTISRSDIRNNSANVGGGVYMTGFSSLIIQHSNVSSNEAKTHGGGISVSESASASMYRMVFTKNTALDGAGIHVSIDGKVDIDASHVERNIALRRGGGLFTDHVYCMVQCGECYDDGKKDTCREPMKQFYRSNGYGQITIVPLEGDERLKAPVGISELTTYQCPRRCVNVTNTIMRFNSATSGAGVFWKLGKGATKAEQTKNEPSIFQCNHRDPEDRAQKKGPFDKIADRSLGASLRYGQRAELIRFLNEGFSAYLKGSVTFAKFKSTNMTSESPRLDKDEEYGSLIEDDTHRPCNEYVPSSALLEEALLDTQACTNWVRSFQNHEYDTSTDTYTLGYGYFPSFGARSGKILAETLGRSPYARALDYYNRVNVLDFTTKCELLLDNSSTVDDDGIALEGKNWKTDLNIKNFNSTARKGILWFNQTRLMGDVGSSYMLKFSDESTRTLCETCDKSPVIMNVTIGPCAPGQALDGGRVCQECPIDTYSTRGEGCLPCPSGAVCRRKVSKGSFNITRGSIRPATATGFYLADAAWDKIGRISYATPGGARDFAVANTLHCNWKQGDCIPGERWDSVERTCKPLNPPGNFQYSQERQFQCIEAMNFYECPLSSESCKGGDDIGGQNCAVGYTNVKCSVCAEGFFKSADQKCRMCVDMGNSANLKIVYTFLAICALSVMAFMTYLYLREDDGAFLIAMARRYFHSKKKKKKIKMSGMETKKSASATPMEKKSMWFRPEKFKIMLTFIQIFAQFKGNYGIRWPPLLSSYMRTFASFNLDILKIAAVDCLYRGTYYFGYSIVTVGPILTLVALGLLLQYGRNLYKHKLEDLARMCIKCGEFVYEWMDESEIARLRHLNTHKVKDKEIFGNMKHIDEMTARERRAHLRKEMKLALKARASGLPGGAYMHKGCKTVVYTSTTTINKVLKYNVPAFKRRCLKRMDYLRYRNKCFRLFFWVMLLTYPTVSTRILRLFQCQQIGEKYFLVKDFRLECYTNLWYSYSFSAYAGAIVYYRNSGYVFWPFVVRFEQRC